MLYANTLHYAEHVALVKGQPRSLSQPVLVRMHAVDFMGDILGGGEDSTLHRSMQMIEEAGEGVIVILREANPDALSRRLKDEKSHAKDGELRRYGIGAQILKDLGVEKMTLLTDSPKNVVGLEGYGLYISGHKPLTV
jgi:3,4-dihydroxy 2-butanone 4-phosphate synthase/GTP cyclohydrolase II